MNQKELHKKLVEQSNNIDLSKLTDKEKKLHKLGQKYLRSIKDLI